MARIHAREDPQVSLFPFLSILVCLIGALVLLIVVFAMVRTRMGDGRTEEQIDRAIKAVDLQTRLQTLEARLEELDQSDAEPARLARELEKDRGLLLELRRRVDENEDAQPTETDAQLQRRLELLVAEKKELIRALPELEHRVAQLRTRAENRREIEEASPRLIVRPAGTGLFRPGTTHFVEANGGGLLLLQQGEPRQIPTDTIGLNKAYNSYLKRLAANPESRLIFLVRRDGIGSWRRAAGWAEGQFNIRTSKLPLPTDGAIDLSLFNR